MDSCEDSLPARPSLMKRLCSFPITAKEIENGLEAFARGKSDTLTIEFKSLGVKLTEGRWFPSLRYL